jgi:mannose-6-phosphate isomerase-like protein (cupin superfamily)
MRSTSRGRLGALAIAACALGFITGGPAHAQAGGGQASTEYWWVNKTAGGVYKPPMRPLWKLADLRRMHAGAHTWAQQIILDPEQDATYHSGAPGTHFDTRLHPDTPAVYVVVAGEVHFSVEGQPAVTATRGSIVNIMKTTLYSYEVAGSQDALWVEVHPTNYKTVYPADGPQPAASAGGKIVRVAFPHKPGAYGPPNRLHWNTFDDSIGKCAPPGAVVLDDHLFANPLVAYVNADDNPCHTGRGNVGNGPSPGEFDAHSTFGHMHPGPAEWWIVQVGQISGKFENAGNFHAVEGDVLYAAPMSWHEMSGEAPSGPSVRLAMGGYPLINMYNTEHPPPGTPAAGTATKP